MTRNTNKKTIANLIGAGTMSALLVATGLLFWGQAPSPPVVDAAPMIVEATTDVAALQQTVDLMQQREAEYRAQIEQANQLLAQNNAPAAYEEGEYEEGEYEEEGEHEEEYEKQEEESYESEEAEHVDHEEYEEDDDDEEEDD